MKPTLRLALLCLALPTVAAAADPERIDRPTLEVGTSWRVRATDGMTRTVLSEATYRISAVNDREVEITDESGSVAIVLDAAHYALKRQGEREFEPALQRYRFPLALGQRWDSAYSYFNPQCGPTQSKLSFKVSTWEDLTLPAGKFRALRIDSDGTWRNGCGTGTQTHKHWVVPGMGVPVKLESTVYAQGRIFSHEVQETLSVSRP